MTREIMREDRRMRLPAATMIAIAFALPGCAGEDAFEDVGGKLRCVGCVAVLGGGARVDFGPVAVGALSEQTVVLENPGSAAITLGVPTPDSPFQIEPLPTIRLQPGGTHEVRFSFRPSAVGDFEQSLVIQGQGASLAVQLRGAGRLVDITCEPGDDVRFGNVVVSSTREVRIHCVNRSADLPVSLSPVLGGDPAFALGDAADLELAPGQAVDLDVQLTPVAPIPYVGTLALATTEGQRPILLRLLGDGIESGLRIEPPPPEGGCYRISAVPGTPARLSLRAVNVGNLPLVLDPIDVAPAMFGLDPGGPYDIPAATTLGTPDGHDFDIVFAPPDIGIFTGTVRLRTDEPTSAVIELCVTGTGHGFELFPDGLRFGVVEPGSSLQLRATFTNNGAPDCCTIEDIRITGAGSEVFILGEEVAGEHLVREGAALQLPVTFQPQAEGFFPADLALVINGLSFSVPLEGVGAASCLAAEPAVVDFGPVAPGCVSAARAVRLTNRCEDPLAIGRLELGASLSDEFRLEGAGPERIPPGASLDVSVSYQPTGPGADAGTLEIQGEGLDAPVIVSLTGSGEPVERQTDRFADGGRAAVDVLWVVMNDTDSTAFNRDRQRLLARNAPAFLDRMLEQDIDFHLVVTSSDTHDSVGFGSFVCPGGVKGEEEGRFFPVDHSAPRILHAGMDAGELKSAWEHNVQVGVCTNAIDTHLEAALLALSPPLIDHADDPGHPEKDDGNLGFLRPEAALFIVFVAHRDATMYRPLDEYLTFFRSLKGEERSQYLLRLSAIAVPDMPPEGGSCAGEPAGPWTSYLTGYTYMALADATGGVFQDICQEDWSPVLTALADKAFEVERCFPLTSRPGPGPTGDPDVPASWFEVSINDERVEVAAPDGTYRYRLDEPTNRLCFAPSWAPRPEDVVTATYPVACGQ